ncbi:MAG: metallophosphoesterase family protein [Phycisphaerales bacterium]|nr:metallophosphoesterase family protein [Phycisphaerales bacterium]
MNIIAFSDIHTDLHAIEKFRSQAESADLLIGAGDYCNMRRGLQPVIDAIASIGTPAVLVHGNAENDTELNEAAAPYDHLHTLHGSTITISNITILGLGGAVPETPFGDWSVDYSEKHAWDLLSPCPYADILVTHSPPKGHCDKDSAGKHLGSKSVLKWTKKHQPRFVLCGHIHASWQNWSDIGPTRVMNLGPMATKIEL